MPQIINNKLAKSKTNMDYVDSAAPPQNHLQFKESRHTSTQHTGGRIGPIDLEIRTKVCKKEVETNNDTLLKII